MYSWFEDDFTGSFFLEKDNKLVCGLHPRPTREYAFYLLKKFFENDKLVQDWYTTPNFWYGEVAPVDMTDRELINRINQMINSVYI